MKKILVFLLAAAVATAMAACSSGAGSSSSESSSSSVSESTPESLPEESLPESSAPEFEIPEANQKLGTILDAARGEEMTGYYPALLSKDDPNAELFSSMFGFNYDDMEAFAIAISPMNVKAYGVAVIKPAEGKTDAVLATVNGFVENQKKAFDNYLPDQGEIAKAATVDTLDDGTIVLVMCEDGATVQSAILTALKG